MKQSKRMSMMETCLSTASGFGLSLLAQWFFLPLLGVKIEFHQNFVFALIMTVISIARGYTLRRIFEFFHIRVPLPPSILAIAAERRRQIEVEGWTSEHDARHVLGEMAQAGACYARMPLSREVFPNRRFPPTDWPWTHDWWKPQDNRRDLIRAGALIAAELDKMDHDRKRSSRRVDVQRIEGKAVPA